MDTDHPDETDSEILPGSSTFFHKKPPHPGYRVSGVPKRLVDQVQLSAVLRSFYGYGRLRTEGDFADATAWIRYYWRRRAKELDIAGWKPISGINDKARIGNALVCPPAFVMIYGGKKDQTHCSLPTLCPFCWARQVRLYWLQLEAAFFPPPRAGKKPERTRVVDTGPLTSPSMSFTRSVKDIETGTRSPYDLVYRRFAFCPPARYSTRVYGQSITLSALVGWIESRVSGQPHEALHRLPECRALLKAAGPGGGVMESVSFHKNVGPGSDQQPWEITVHQLILAHDGDTIPKLIYAAATDESKRHIIIRKPQRTALAQRVSEAFIYPRFLLDLKIPVHDVIEYLNARRGHRLVASYGRFRSRTLK